MIAVRPWAEVVADLRELRTQSRLPNDAADLIESLVAERDVAQAVVAEVRAALDQYADDVTAGVTYGAAAIDAMSAVAKAVGR